MLLLFVHGAREHAGSRGDAARTTGPFGERMKDEAWAYDHDDVIV